MKRVFIELMKDAFLIVSIILASQIILFTIFSWTGFFQKWEVNNDWLLVVIIVNAVGGFFTAFSIAECIENRNKPLMFLSEILLILTVVLGFSIIIGLPLYYIRIYFLIKDNRTVAGG